MVNEDFVPDEVLKLRELNSRLESVEEWAEIARSKALSKFKKETVYIETQQMPRKHKLREVSKTSYDARLQEIDDTVNEFKIAWRQIRETLDDDIILNYTAERWEAGIAEAHRLAAERVKQRIAHNK
jgi:hypothetical protein